MSFGKRSDESTDEWLERLKSIQAPPDVIGDVEFILECEKLNKIHLFQGVRFRTCPPNISQLYEEYTCLHRLLDPTTFLPFADYSEATTNTHCYKAVRGGSGIRGYVADKADSLGVTGYIMQLEFGICLQVEGTQEQLQLFLDFLDSCENQGLFVSSGIIVDSKIKVRCSTKCEIITDVSRYPFRVWCHAFEVYFGAKNSADEEAPVVKTHS